MARNYRLLSPIGTIGPDDALEKKITAEKIRRQNAFFATGITRDIVYRRQRLIDLGRIVSDSYDAVKDALQRDLKKPEFESYVTEIAFFFQELDLAIKKLGKWAKPRKVKTPWLLWPAQSSLIPEPLGTVLIIGPWNYPFQLVMAPLVAALAAGNTVVVKPSEVAPHTSGVIQQILSKAYDPEYVTTIEGGVETTQSLLKHRFDKIFFTGGVAVGKIIMEAASHHLTPVTLELGGKSPAIIAQDAQLQQAAKKVAWGKFINSGQTCLAPDYVLVHRDKKEAFIGEVARALRDFYGSNAMESPDYARIINRKHFDRVLRLIGNSRILHGGNSDRDDLYIEPTLLEPVSLESPLMEEEIFGPLLPIVGFSTLDEAISIVNSKPKPLALYLFTRDKATKRRILQETSSGGVVVNDTIVHVANSHLPFGGVGPSGMGAYHGKHGFDAFSHRKSVVARRYHIDMLFRYPPYRFPVSWLRKLLG